MLGALYKGGAIAVLVTFMYTVRQNYRSFKRHNLVNIHWHLTIDKYLLSRLDAFDTWALCKIFRIPYTCQMSNAEVRGTTGCSPFSHLLTNRRLRLFGHIVHRLSHKDHHRVLAAAIRQVPPNWKRPVGRPSHTWLRAIEADLGLLNFGLTTAWRKATTPDEWRHIVNTATLQWSTLWKNEEEAYECCETYSYSVPSVRRIMTTFVHHQ